MLAGGRSTRFGNDKLMASYRGMPLLHHAILRVREVCTEVVVVLAPEAPEPAIPVGANVRFVHDAREGEGPLAGLLAGLEAASAELAIVAGGDMPDLSTAVLLEMLRVAGEAPVDAVTLEDGDRLRPLPSVLRVAEAGAVARGLLDAGERRLRALIEMLGVVTVGEPVWTRLDPDRRTLFDVDEPGHLGRH